MTLSVKKLFERTEPGMLRTDNPCDAGYVWTAMDNIAHMVDVSPKYRINFLNQVGTPGQLDINGKSRAFYFITELYDGDVYPGYDLRIAMAAPSRDVPVRASIALPTVQAPVTESSNGVLFTITATAVDDTIAWVVDEQIAAQPVSNAPFSTQLAPNVDGSGAAVAHHIWLKLLIEDLEEEDEEDGPRIIGIQLREFSQ